MGSSGTDTVQSGRSCITAAFVKDLASPEGSVLYFAGEATSSTDMQMTHGAMASGKRAAFECLETFGRPRPSKDFATASGKRRSRRDTRLFAAQMRQKAEEEEAMIEVVLAAEPMDYEPAKPSRGKRKRKGSSSSDEEWTPSGPKKSRTQNPKTSKPAQPKPVKVEASDRRMRERPSTEKSCTQCGKVFSKSKFGNFCRKSCREKYQKRFNEEAMGQAAPTSPQAKELAPSGHVKASAVEAVEPCVVVNVSVSVEDEDWVDNSKDSNLREDNVKEHLASVGSTQPAIDLWIQHVKKAGNQAPRDFDAPESMEVETEQVGLEEKPSQNSEMEPAEPAAKPKKKFKLSEYMKENGLKKVTPTPPSSAATGAATRGSQLKPQSPTLLTRRSELRSPEDAGLRINQRKVVAQPMGPPGPRRPQIWQPGLVSNSASPSSPPSMSVDQSPISDQQLASGSIYQPAMPLAPPWASPSGLSPAGQDPRRYAAQQQYQQHQYDEQPTHYNQHGYTTRSYHPTFATSNHLHPPKFSPRAYSPNSFDNSQQTFSSVARSAGSRRVI